MSQDHLRPESLTPEAVLTYANFGFEVTQTNDHGIAMAWTKELSGETINFRRLGWWNLEELSQIVQLQKDTWGMEDQDLVPGNILAIICESGTDVYLATDSQGQWAGFLFGIVSYQHGQPKIRSHMMGVREDMRGGGGVGWNLKILQAIGAHENGIHHMEWTADPLRSVNGRVNVEKLGTTVSVYTIDKYGQIVSTLYGNIPTDRFTFEWDLTSARTLERLLAVNNGTYKGLGLNDVELIPTVNPSKDGSVTVPQSKQVKVEIPGDVDQLDDNNKTSERRRLRQVFSSLMTTAKADSGQENVTQGVYTVVGLATGTDEATGERRSFYILENVNM